MSTSNNTFRQCVIDILEQAVKRDDITTICSLWNIFDFLECDYAEYDGLDRIDMIDFLASVIQAMKQGIDKKVIIECIDNLANHPETAEAYYRLPNLLDTE